MTLPFVLCLWGAFASAWYGWRTLGGVFVAIIAAIQVLA